MNTQLKVGRRLFSGDQVVSALVQYKLFDAFIGHVILDEIVSQVSLSQEEVFRALVGTHQAPLPQNFSGFLSRWCEHQRMTPAYFNEVLLRDLRVEKFKQVFFEGQIESEFLRSKAELDQVEYSLIRLENAALAQELYFQLRDDGAEFAQLAQQYSLGHEQQTDGWIGPVALVELPDAIAHLFRSQPVGTLYPPQRVGDEFWLLRLEHRSEARLTAATRTLLRNRLYQRWLQGQTQKAIATAGAVGLVGRENERSLKGAS